MVTTILKTLKKHVRNCLTIQNNWRLSANFWHNQKFVWFIKTFWTIRKIFRLSGNFPGYLETFWTIRKISRLSGNFPKGPETSQCNFKGYAQKLSGRAKTFRMAMPPCHPGFWASAATSIALIAQTRSRTTANVCSMRSKKRIHILSLVKRQWTGIGLPEKMSMSDLPWGAKGEALGRRLADADENMQGEKVWWEILQRKRLQPQAMHSRKVSRYILSSLPSKSSNFDLLSSYWLFLKKMVSVRHVQNLTKQRFIS